MSCMENICQRHDCTFYQFSNEVIKMCPLCGDRVLNFWDEELDHESPSGDDYDDMIDFED